MNRCLARLAFKKENQELIRSKLPSDKDEAIDTLYEMCFMKENGSDLKTIFSCLKQGSLGLNHLLFDNVSKKMKEADLYSQKPFDVTEGVETCSKCKSIRTISYGKQTRSSDEGATVFVFCIDCKYRYFMNS